jgi:hypothetical protein
VSGTNIMTKEDGTPIENGVGYTGGIREQGRTCGTTQCHHVIGGGNVNQRDSLITSSVPPEGYRSGFTYQMAVTLTEPFRVKYGFMASPQANNAVGDARGTLSVVDDSAQLRTGNNYIAVSHTEKGNQAPNETKTWHFNWQAPSQVGLGEVLFFVACNASNNDDTTTGDRIYLDTMFLPEAIDNGTSSLFSEGGFSARLQSNPVRDMATVVMTSNATTRVEWALFDVSGRTAKPWTSVVVADGDVQTIPMTALPAGAYIAVFRNAERSSALRITKL